MFSMFSMFASKEKRVDPFTTQARVLDKYHLGRNKKGEFVGMCRPMSNPYLDEILNGRDPSIELADDKQFVKSAILEENAELMAEEAGELDVDHIAFKKNNIQHTHGTIEPGKLGAGITQLLESSDHLLLNFPVGQLEHQVYIGKDKTAKNGCRLFDANRDGAEKRGPCSQLVKDFVGHLEKTYPQIKTSTINVGIGHN